MAAQATTVTNDVDRDGIRKITVAWTSAAAGTVTQIVHNINGQLLRITTDPGATAPTDNYDVTLEDSDAVDVLLGLGANRDTANTEHICPLLGDATSQPIPVVTLGQHTLKITAAGDAKTGTVFIYWRELW